MILFASLEADNVIASAALPGIGLVLGRGCGIVVQGILLGCCLDT